MAAVSSLKVLGRFSKAKGIFRSVGKTWYSIDVIKKEGIFERMKKYVLGEEAPSKDTAEIEDSYFQLSKVTEPPVYTMETHEIIDKLENIVTEAIPDAGEKWQNESVSDKVIKYKVLSKCYKEFGLLVPNYQLTEMNSVGDVIQYFTSAKPKDTRTFRSIDMDNLPPNLTIGGVVPWKVASQ